MRNVSWARLVPELLVGDMSASLSFWTGLGFSVLYRREEEGFAYLDLDGAQIMLEEVRANRTWVTGPLQRPYGRGINFQIAVPAIEPLVEALRSQGWPLFLAPEERWYRADGIEFGVRQFLAQDPDGYLLRFSASIGQRPWAG
ncbi:MULTISPECIES: VOC family protein [unclassified Achromobacter]|uniref:bleomycin resistance protein n=1 Tax=unclassified Achromobacter TaxID=2626865 RepID=UPI00069D7BF4|nr:MULTISPECIES: VOC family protein [unclassified Achromobacter]KOF54327.1 glyoxalase [Achromobacter sp. DMS1]